MIKRLVAKTKVLRAYLDGNSRGKTQDVHGRDYRQVFDRYGFKIMVDEYLSGNTWGVK